MERSLSVTHLALPSTVVLQRSIRGGVFTGYLHALRKVSLEVAVVRVRVPTITIHGIVLPLTLVHVPVRENLLPPAPT